MKEYLRFEIYASMGAGWGKGKPGIHLLLESWRKLKLKKKY
jgi:hypothetical protein